MKCISLWQPWASLVALRAKQIETRSWPTKYRGPIAIHAAKMWNSTLIAMCRMDPFDRVLSHFGHRFDRSSHTGLRRSLPFGAVLCVAELYDCVEITATNAPKGDERAFGDYTPGRFMWKTRNVQRLADPYPCVGRQGFFELDDRLFTRELESLRAA